jgi:hypothetical protein
LEQAGFRVSKLLYRFPWLFLPALVIRKLSRGSGKSDLRPVSPALNSLLAFLAWLSDSSVAPELPFGTSLFAVAVKKP